MKVAELVAKLEKFPKDLEVVFGGDYGAFNNLGIKLYQTQSSAVCTTVGQKEVLIIETGINTG